MDRQRVKNFKKVKVIVEKERGHYWMFIPKLKGVTSGGVSFQQASKQLEESIEININLKNIPDKNYKLKFLQLKDK